MCRETKMELNESEIQIEKWEGQDKNSSNIEEEKRQEGRSINICEGAKNAWEIRIEEEKKE